MRSAVKEKFPMKNKLLATMAVLGLGLALVPATFAQNSDAAQAPTPPPMGDGGPHGGKMPDSQRQLRHMTKELDLTTDQQAQVKQILEARDSQMEQNHANTSQSVQQQRQTGMTIMKDSNDKVMAILNDQQKQKFQAMQQEHMQHMREHMGGGAPAPAPGGDTPLQQ
jgi:Spy/CpxP family protein refolding chaperone